MSYLRAEGSPTPGIRHTMAMGVSLSGHFLRHFLDLGMNRDEGGRRVFDGVLAHISGAGKVFANEPFAMPYRTATQHEDRYYPEVWFPYGAASAAAPASGRAGSLLHGDGSDPVLIETNTSTEYWQKAASLIHTDPNTGAEAALPPTARAYLIAGTQHGGRAGTPGTPGACANPRNVRKSASTAWGVSTDVGSSMMSNCGPCNRQRTISTRWRSPTDLECTGRSGSRGNP